MRWLLRILQRFSRVRRRILGSTTPHWVKDSLPLLGYVNVIDLLPTLLAITLAPRHFYMRLPQYTKSKRSWFKTPLKFFTSGVTLIVTLLFILAPDALKLANIDDRTVAARYVAVICLASPIAIPIFCLALRFLLGMASAIPNVSIPKSLKSNLLIPVSPRTYARLRLASFSWSIFYYGIYFFIASQVVQLFAFYEMQLFGFMVSINSGAYRCNSELSKLDPTGITSIELREKFMKDCLMLHGNSSSTSYEGFMLCGFIGIFAIAAYFIVVNPYLSVLRASVKIPTKRMHRSDWYEVKETIDEFALAVHKGAKKNQWKGAQITLGNLEEVLARLMRDIVRQDRAASKLAGIYLEKLKRERRAVIKKLIPTGALESLRESESLPYDLRVRIISLVDRLKILTGEDALPVETTISSSGKELAIAPKIDVSSALTG
jgi:hypothetical protein